MSLECVFLAVFELDCFDFSLKYDNIWQHSVTYCTSEFSKFHYVCNCSFSNLYTQTYSRTNHKKPNLSLSSFSFPYTDTSPRMRFFFFFQGSMAALSPYANGNGTRSFIAFSIFFLELRDRNILQAVSQGGWKFEKKKSKSVWDPKIYLFSV